MTVEQITEEIVKQINLGFSTNEIKKNMYQKGLNKAELDNILQKLTLQQNDIQSDSYVRIYAILLVIIGVIYTLTLRPVSGGLRFPFESSGDLIRWRELFFQPLGGLFLLIFGIVLFIKKRKFNSLSLRIIGIIWFSILAFSSAFSNNLLNTIIGLATIVFIVILTKRKA